MRKSGSLRRAVLTGLMLGMVPALAMPLAAQAQVERGTNGRNVVQVTYGGGSRGEFAMLEGGTWVERDSGGRTIFRFRETMRDEWSVYLADDARDLEIQLDIFRRKILIAEGRAPRRDLYDITSASSTGRSSRWSGGARAPNRGILFNIEAGPIWNQQHAEQRCRQIADQTHGEWTGAWRTTVQNKMSVCEIRFR